MKKVILNILLMSYLSVSAQTETSPLENNTKKNSHIKYIESSATSGGTSAVIVDEVPLAHTVQFLPLNKDGELVGKDDLAGQVDQVFKNISIALKKAKAGIEDIVKMNVYIPDAGLTQKIQDQFNRKFGTGKKPAVSFVVGSMMMHENALLAIDVIAVSKISPDTKVKYLRSNALFGDSQRAQVSILPATSVVYISGQADKGKLAEATIGTLKQLEATLTYLGLKKEDVVQIKAFVCPVTDYKIAEKEISAFFTGMTIPPVIYVDWLSKDPVIEIELIAASPKISPKASEQLEFITPTGMTKSQVYSKVTRINYGKKIYLSSLCGEKTDDPNSEVASIFTSLTDILNKAGSDLNHLAKATYYVSDAVASAKLNELRPKYYDPKRPPAASKATVKGVGLIGKGISVDMIGVVVEK